MNLGDLEFNGRELEELKLEFWDGDKLQCKLGPGQAYELAMIINRILCEKLAEAPEVFGVSTNFSPIGTSYYPANWARYKLGSDTHRARLLCIEELK